MSKIGKQPIEIPEGVEVKITPGKVEVKGPKGTLCRLLPKELKLNLKDNRLWVEKIAQNGKAEVLSGTFRSLIFNMVKGVSEGWRKELELVGTGYRAEATGEKLILNVGYSHPIEIMAPENISFRVEKNTILIEGIDKETVGQVAAKIRAVRPPEPYKGKGIKYTTETVRRKAGKAAKAQTA